MTVHRHLSVMIIGGGIGGLCLAHGLRRAGVEVTVHERTTARTDWVQGYRIHLNPDGCRALHACLPPEGWRAFLDLAGTGGGGFGFMTEQARDLLRFTEGEINTPDSHPAARHYGVSRISLRHVLLTGLDDVVRLGHEFVGYEHTPDGRVTARFADGTSDTADVLVGADGANSRVRRQLLPHAHRLDTGIVAVAGKYRLTPETTAGLPTALTTDANIVIPADRGMMFTAVWHRDRHTGQVDAAPPGLLLDNRSDYAFWAYSDAADRFPHPLTDLDGPAWRQLVLDRIGHWAPALRDLVGGSDPDTVNAMTVRSAGPVTAWPTGPVTLLGDAIHNMTPMAGIGANTALRDADLLRHTLVGVRDGSADLVAALAAYEKRMLRYGFAAVRTSLRNARQAGRMGPVGRTAFRTVLRTVDTVTPLRTAMARSMRG